MRPILRFLWSVAVVLLPSIGAAQDWAPIAPQYGNGFGICDNRGNAQNCLVLRCDPERGLQFSFVSTAGVPQNATGILRVDGGQPTTVSWRASGVPGELEYNHGGFDHAPLLRDMLKGQRLRVVLSEQFEFPLGGVRKAITQTIAACADRQYARLTSMADIESVAEKLDSRISPSHISLTYIHDKLTLGPVIDSGQSNPSLIGIGREACIAQCLGRSDCLIAGYDDTSGMCSLQSDLGPLADKPGVLTTLIATRPTVVKHPQLPGPGLAKAKGLKWVPGEDWRGYVKRRRDAAMSLGQDCQAEANEMARFASGMAITPPGPTAVAGDPFDFAWSSARLGMRIPAWIILSVDRPARFGGDGFYALNVGAIGPFGVAQDMDQQRAFAPVYAESGVDGGRIEVTPLEAGTYTVRATLVSYLRACQQELPLAQAEWQISVAAAAPRIVLRDITAGHPYDRRIEVPEHGRRIELNETRFLIQNLEDGSEILSREGKNLRLSPTKRYVVIHDNANYDIFDIVDGAKVARVLGAMLTFWNADSFFLSEIGYWGQISIGTTLQTRLLIDNYQTGSACCFNKGRGGMFVDLENNIASLQSMLNPDAGSVRSLLDGSNLGQLEAPKLAPKNGHFGGSFGQYFATGVDFVAPMEIGPYWDTPLGPLYVHTPESEPVRDSDQPYAAIISAQAKTETDTITNPDFGKGTGGISSTLPALTILRGRSEKRGDPDDKGFASALERWGVFGASLITPRVSYFEETDIGFSGNDNLRLQDPKYQLTLRQLEADMRKLGKGLEWSIPDPSYSIAERCIFFPQTVGPEEQGGDQTKSTDSIEIANRFETGGRVIWVTKASCFGGATAAGANSNYTLNIFDSAAPFSWHGQYRVLEESSFGGDMGQAILANKFQTKLFNENLVVIYAPAQGALMVFDLSTREFRLKLPYARRGDLLEDVFVDADGRHLFQLNSDGSFTVYRLSDGAAILEGRYLDDELVVWTADFNFDATEEGAAFVELRFPGQAGQYSFQQFDGTLRVPGLLQTVLSGGSVPVPQTVGVPPRMEGRIATTANRITGFAMAKGTRPIKAVRLFQDGVLTSSFATTPGQLIELDAGRNTGVRWATLVAEDVDGLVSLPLNVDLGPDPTGLPRTHFLGVAVDYYVDTQLEPLNYAKLDAVTMSDTFAALNGRSVSLVTNAILTDRRASLEAIPEAVDSLLAAAQPGDHVVLFFAGHGLQDPQGNFYFGLSRTDLGNLPNTALNWQDLSRRFAGKGVRITVLLDACHAGAAGTQAFATNDAAVAGLTVALSGSMTVLSAAKGRQFSGESASVGGGYFTNAIRDVLLDSRATFDENHNGLLEVVEFYRGVKTRVIEKRGAAQTPWLSRNQLVGEYGLF